MSGDDRVVRAVEVRLSVQRMVARNALVAARQRAQFQQVPVALHKCLEIFVFDVREIDVTARNGHVIRQGRFRRLVQYFRPHGFSSRDGCRFHAGKRALTIHASVYGRRSPDPRDAIIQVLLSVNNC